MKHRSSKRSTSPARRKSKSPTSAELMAQDIRQIRREAKRLNNEVRYAVYEQPFGGVNVRFFLDVSEDMYHLSPWTHATLFKQERIARLIARDYSVQQQRTLRVARVTIKASGKRGGTKR